MEANTACISYLTITSFLGSYGRSMREIWRSKLQTPDQPWVESCMVLYRSCVLEYLGSGDSILLLDRVGSPGFCHEAGMVEAEGLLSESFH